MPPITTSPVRSASGVSLGTSEASVGAGLSSCSEKICSSNGFLGVVNAGLRNGEAVLRAEIWGAKEAACGSGGRGFVGERGLIGEFWAKGFGLEESLDGVLKTADCEHEPGVAGQLSKSRAARTAGKNEHTALLVISNLLRKRTRRVRGTSVLVLPLHMGLMCPAFHGSEPCRPSFDGKREAVAWGVAQRDVCNSREKVV